MKAFKPHLLALPDYPYTARQALIKLDQNESPYGLPPELKAELAARLEALPLNRYPEMHAESLAERIADFEGWPEAGVVVGPGSNTIITALVAASQRVLDVHPSFALYKHAAELLGTPYRAVPLEEGFALPVEALLAALAEEEPQGVFFLPNPHTPTGHFFMQDRVQVLCEAAAQHDWLMILDEAYYQFAPADLKRQALGQPHLGVLRTFSKAWGLAGARAGYLLASEEVARVVRHLLPPFGVPAPTALAVELALEHPGYVTEAVEKVRRERERVYLELKAHPTWTAYPSHTNFLLVRTPDAQAAFEGLLKRGILVRRQDHIPGLEGTIRVTIGTPVENDAFLQAAFELAKEEKEIADAASED
ncbi:pyridoxal phosphate-dependent aminotransferase [Oceanithermus profundus]|uniref:Histidinol phosphate aminotransferase apoenzyme n=1 Tax=Oceanithermus profundus (strain DSM 14977 / NBRC 100410 / VKM B-2274 / 506) TaxID=670487 RepID=E4U733_OCEP5|nr:histidinol-phosphate transaminase [Oceanithermus profundus]ADR36036.1 histidinol phosphate aminotransferase apoenzyme [Oceanithermus profundus DSM 14977]